MSYFISSYVNLMIKFLNSPKLSQDKGYCVLIYYKKY